MDDRPIGMFDSGFGGLTVAPGTYRENLVVRRAVTLRGPEGAVGSVRIAPPDGVPLTIRASVTHPRPESSPSP